VRRTPRYGFAAQSPPPDRRRPRAQPPRLGQQRHPPGGRGSSRAQMYRQQL